jgi:hypothetical protein
MSVPSKTWLPKTWKIQWVSATAYFHWSDFAEIALDAMLPSTPNCFHQTYDGFFSQLTHPATCDAFATYYNDRRKHRLGTRLQSKHCARFDQYFTRIRLQGALFPDFRERSWKFSTGRSAAGLVANVREFIRRTAELVEKRRDEYATNDEFSKNLTLNISKLPDQSYSNLAEWNYNVGCRNLQNFSFLSAIEKKLWEGLLWKFFPIFLKSRSPVVNKNFSVNGQYWTLQSFKKWTKSVDE